MQCTKIEHTKDLFSLKKKNHSMHTRNYEIYEVVKAHTKGHQSSTLPNVEKLKISHAPTWTELPLFQSILAAISYNIFLKAKWL